MEGNLNRVRPALAAALSVALLAVAAVPAFAASDWDGYWGSVGNHLLISGQSIQFDWDGTRGTGTQVQMTDKVIRFVGGGMQWIVYGRNDHSLLVQITAGGKTSGMGLCRNPPPRATTCP